MSQQVLSSRNLHHRHGNNDDEINCFGYVVNQCNFYVEHFGIIMKKVICKSWSIKSKQSTRKKKKQKSTNLRNCETLSTIDVISLFQSNTHCQQQFTASTTLVNPLSISSKPQISRQLLESLITVIDSKMPLAQNYKDDVSLLESEAALTNVTMERVNTDFGIHQETNTKANRGNDRSSNVSTTTMVSTNSMNMLADDDLPDIVSTVSLLIIIDLFHSVYLCMN
ncbi:hypothetical protein I4U23_009438 [Adineta vaga]|nr:hypothetical protein I4U23_009438 [Adineta vaga]